MKNIVINSSLARVLVFTRTKHGAEKVVKALSKEGFKIASIHGNKSQSQRQKSLLNFKNGSCPILVATDIAARGIDVPGVEVVVNFDLPEVPENYVHRIGRTARAGASGSAISLCAESDHKKLRAIEKLIKSKIKVVNFNGASLNNSTGKMNKIPHNNVTKDKKKFSQLEGKKSKRQYSHSRKRRKTTNSNRIGKRTN